MFGLETIRAMNDEVAVKAKKRSKKPTVIVNLDRIDKMPPFPFPNYGTNYEPDGWEFADDVWSVIPFAKEGDGMAYGTESFKRALRGKLEKLNPAKRRKLGFAVVSTGQFVVNVGLFRKVEVNADTTTVPE